MIVAMGVAVWISLFLSGVCAAGPQPKAVRIRLQPDAEVSGPSVLLGEIALISGPEAITRKLSNLAVGRSPRPGLKRILPQAKIQYALRSHTDLDTLPVITGPERIQIQRAYQSLSERQLNAIIQAYVRTCLPDASFQISNLSLNGRNRFPTGKLQAAVVRHNTNQLLGSVTFVLSLHVSPEITETATASAWISRFEKVVCTRRALSRNQVITGQDLYLRKLDLSRAPGNLYLKTEDVIGQQTKLRLRADTALRSSMLTIPPTIYKGDRVKIVAGKGLLQVSASGRARMDGYLNQPITVQNLQSKKLITGTVVDSSTVQVRF